MRIAVDTRFLMPDFLEDHSHFTVEICRLITQQHLQHEFFFLFDQPYNEQFIFSKNIIPIIINPSSRHILLKWWYDKKISRILQKIKADIFICPNGLCNLATRVPQILILHECNLFYKKHLPVSVKKANLIATTTEFSKNNIIKKYNINAAKIHVTGNGIKKYYQPVNWKQKEAIKEQYTDGKEYFLYIGSAQGGNNLIHLLKAFSLFKKRLQSNMQLIIAGQMTHEFSELKTKIDTYKYRNETKLLGHVNNQELARLTAGAYALVYPSLFDYAISPVLEAMQCEVPIITSNRDSMAEIAENAALYADPHQPEAIAQQMQTIYKDENLRNQLIEAGKEQIRKFSWEKTANALWQCIEEVGTSHK